MRKAFKNFMEGMKKDERGMTLVELLAVIVILAIVGAIAFVVIGNVIDNSRQDSHIANAQQIINAAELAEASGEVFGEDTETDINLEDLENLGELIDPWGTLDAGVNENGYGRTFALNKVGGEFQINSTYERDGNSCQFTAASKSILSTAGRDLCKDENDGTGETGS